MPRMSTRESAALIVIALFASACDHKPSSSEDGGTKAAPTVSVRTTRLDCGGTFGACPAGESCYFDNPGCDATGHCGGAEKPCVRTTSFCGCKAIDLACEFPKHPWIEKGPQCFSESAFNVHPTSDAAAASDAGTRADASK
ncbi:hypothetical protein BH09MYX1_BH09MYX1_61560 [soil metagenome]